MYCTKCGNLVPDNQQICDTCGDDLFAQRDLQNVSDVAPNKPVEINNQVEPDSSNGKLHFYWEGDDSKDKSCELSIILNGTLYGPYNYNEGFVIELPIDSSKLNLEILVDGKKWLSHQFDIENGADYSSSLTGTIYKPSGLEFAISKPGEAVEENAPKIVSGGNFKTAFYSFLFPVYGIYKAITNPYYRVAAIVAGSVGFFFGFIFDLLSYSSLKDGDKLVFGFGKAELFEYEPFSILDFLINIFVGGISTIRGLLYSLFESLLG